MENIYNKLLKAAKRAGANKLYSYNVANNKIPVIVLDDTEMLFKHGDLPITAALNILGAGGIYITESFWNAYKGTKTMEFAIANELWYILNSMDFKTVLCIAAHRVLGKEYSPSAKYDQMYEADLYACGIANIGADDYENIRAEITNFGILALDVQAPDIQELKVIDEVVWKLKFQDNLESITA